MNAPLPAWLFFALGAVAGVAQAALLRRAARGAAGPMGFALRMGLVVVALLAAAIGGHLLAGAAGWAVGLVATGAVLVWRWT